MMATRTRKRAFLTIRSRLVSFFSLTAWQGQSWQQPRFSMCNGAHAGSSGSCTGTVSGSLSRTRVRISQNSFPIRDFLVDIVDGLDMDRVSMSLVSLRIGLEERTVLAFVQEESVRAGATGGDSGEKREASTGWSGGGMYIERCSLNLEEYSLEGRGVDVVDGDMRFVGAGN